MNFNFKFNLKVAGTAGILIGGLGMLVIARYTWQWYAAVAIAVVGLILYYNKANKNEEK